MVNDRWDFCASLFSPLIVAAVVVTGLASLSVQNLNGSSAVHQIKLDHAAAVQRLLFRS